MGAPSRLLCPVAFSIGTSLGLDKVELKGLVASASNRRAQCLGARREFRCVRRSGAIHLASSRSAGGQAG